MSNNTQETITEQQRYCQKCLKKVDSITKKTKRGYKKRLVIITKNCLRKKKIKKRD